MVTRLTSPSGSTVSVADERAESLLAQGYKAVDEKTKKAPAKKSAAPSKSDK